MKIIKQINLNLAWMILAACGLSLRLGPPLHGPGDRASGRCLLKRLGLFRRRNRVLLRKYLPRPNMAQATALADLTECCYLSAIRVDLQLLDNGNQVADTGTPGSTYESTS